MLLKILKWIYKEIIHSDFIVYNLVFLSGVMIFYALIGSKIGGKYAPLILIGSSLILGIGLYGIFRWIIKNCLYLLIFLIKFILFGNIEVTITNGKIGLHPYLKK